MLVWEKAFLQVLQLDDQYETVSNNVMFEVSIMSTLCFCNYKDKYSVDESAEECGAAQCG